MTIGFAVPSGDPERTGGSAATRRADDGWADMARAPAPSADAMGWNTFSRPWRRDIGFGL